MRKPCCEKQGTNKGAWSKQEDQKLIDSIRKHGEGCWSTLPQAAGLLRCGKSCRLRWINYLRPDIKRGNFAEDEEDLIIKLHALLGNRWSLIAGRLPGRTDNEVKNYWNSHLRRRLISMGIDPNNHRVIRTTTNDDSTPNPGNERSTTSAATSETNKNPHPDGNATPSTQAKTHSRRRNNCANNKDRSVSDSESFLEDGTSINVPDLNLDLAITTVVHSSANNNVVSVVVKEEEKNEFCCESAEIISKEAGELLQASSNTLLLFR